MTFNYDRSLEYHLMRSLKTIDMFEERDVDLFFEKRIVHIYGDIKGGDGYWADPTEDRKYRSRMIITGGAQYDIGKFIPLFHFMNKSFAASGGIRTIDPHDKSDAATLRLARLWLSKASVTYILGYGFDDNNNRRIGLDSLFSPNAQKNKSAMFTNFNDFNAVNKRAGMALLRAHGVFLDGKSSWGVLNGGTYLEKSVRSVYDALEMDFDAMETRVSPRVKSKPRERSS